MRRKHKNTIKNIAATAAFFSLILFSGITGKVDENLETETNKIATEYTISGRVIKLDPRCSLVTVETEDGSLFDFYGDNYVLCDKVVLTLKTNRTKGKEDDSVVGCTLQ